MLASYSLWLFVIVPPIGFSVRNIPNVGGA